jgi:hypothetical protein
VTNHRLAEITGRRSAAPRQTIGGRGGIRTHRALAGTPVFKTGSVANVLADIQQIGANSVLTLDASHAITLTNVQHTSLADFHLV